MPYYRPIYFLFYCGYGLVSFMEHSRWHLKKKHPHLVARKTNSLHLVAKLHASFQLRTSHRPRRFNENQLSKLVYHTGSWWAAKARIVGLRH